MALKMTPQQQAVFQLYVAIGEGRSINLLHSQLQGNDSYKDISLRTLQRWSAQFHWPDLAKQVNDRVVDAVVEKMAPVIEDMAAEQINALHTVQRRFIERLALDPNDPTLTEEQRKRAIEPDFRDFQDAVKLERLIIGDPTERRETVHKESPLAAQLTKQDLVNLALEITRAKFGAAKVIDSQVIDVKVKELPGGTD